MINKNYPKTDLLWKWKRGRN